MIRSIDTLNRNMNILQKKQENVSTNIANTNTPGYKYQQVVQSTLESQILINYTGGNGTQKRELGSWTFGNRVDGIITSFSAGNIVETEDPLDFAIPGEGFFVLNLTTGERAYTRNGNFVIDQENRLATMEGHQVVGVGADGGEIFIELDQSGEILNGTRLLTAVIPQDAELQRMGDTIFLDPGNTAAAADAEPVRGFLEMSNVIVADEMVRLIQIAREFEANQKALQTSEDTLNKAVNEIGRV
jgi:flagellar basal-body rod protein FlgG